MLAVVAVVEVGLTGKLLTISTDSPFVFRIRWHLNRNALGATKTDLSPFPLLKGRGGSSLCFLCFVICCSPSFGGSKMGSFVSQLQAVVEI